MATDNLGETRGETIFRHLDDMDDLLYRRRIALNLKIIENANRLSRTNDRIKRAREAQQEILKLDAKYNELKNKRPKRNVFYVAKSGATARSIDELNCK